MREDRKTLIFAAIVCVTCSLLLSVTAAALKSRQEANATLDVQKNILKAFGVEITKETSVAEIDEIYSSSIKEEVIDASNGNVIDGLTIDAVEDADLSSKSKLPLYRWEEGGKTTKYAFPISGKGLWGDVFGYLAIKSDLQTIAGISFYKHKETPGLGAEIEKSWFQEQFEGKKLYANGDPVDFKVVKPGTTVDSKEEYCVDGISGATLTGKGVQAFINADAARYSEYFSSIKGQ